MKSIETQSYPNKETSDSFQVEPDIIIPTKYQELPSGVAEELLPKNIIVAMI